MEEKIEHYGCPKCGESISKHKFYFNGSRRHVESYGSLGTHCNESDCEINHNCSDNDEAI